MTFRIIFCVLFLEFFCYVMFGRLVFVFALLLRVFLLMFYMFLICLLVLTITNHHQVLL